MPTPAKIHVSVSGSRRDSLGNIYYDGVGNNFLLTVRLNSVGGYGGNNTNGTISSSLPPVDFGGIFDAGLGIASGSIPLYITASYPAQTVTRGGGYSDTYGPTTFYVPGPVYFVPTGSEWRYPATGSIIVYAGISMSPTAFSSSKDTFYAVSDNYENSLSTFKNKLTYADSITLPQPYAYNPARVENITTRLLELRESTITPGLRFAAMADGRAVQLAILNRINDIISSYSSNYPTLTLDTGEGIPYQ
jgi:hypothetical protein